MDNPMDKHNDFILEKILPAIAKQSLDANCDMLEAGLAVFLAMGTILHNQGITEDVLMMAIRGSALETHNAPGGLQ